MVASQYMRRRYVTITYIQFPAVAPGLRRACATGSTADAPPLAHCVGYSFTLLILNRSMNECEELGAKLLFFKCPPAVVAMPWPAVDALLQLGLACKFVLYVN